MLKAIILLIIGFIMLMKGADIFVEGTSKIAELFHIPQIVIGLTIVAMGTSLPEAAISITATFNNASGITIGNIIGSNILNVLLILGICATISPLKVGLSTFKYEIPFMGFITLILLLLGRQGMSIGTLDGFILFGLFLCFIGYLFWLTKSGQETSLDEVEELGPNDTIIKLLVLVIIGMVCIVVGSNFTVEGAKTIAKEFGISDRIIGLTVVAFGTSLPELITSVTAVSKGKNGIAIGNIVGSNIFNILFVLGICGMIPTQVIPFTAAFTKDAIVAFGSCVLLYVLCGKNLTVKRSGGILLLLCFVGYYSTLFF